MNVTHKCDDIPLSREDKCIDLSHRLTGPSFLLLSSGQGKIVPIRVLRAGEPADSSKRNGRRKSTTNKEIHFQLPLGVLGSSALFVFCLAIVGAVSVGVHPGLAESVVQLVQQENIENAEEAKFRREEILWFARILYSESEFTSEQEYVGWAVRNRVESEYYPDTYKEVALQPHQFSGLNHYDQWYEVNISRDYGKGDNVWESALRVAEYIYDAPESERLLPKGTTHFFSPVAVRRTPKWAIGKEPVETLYGRLGVRFAFYKDVN